VAVLALHFLTVMLAPAFSQAVPPPVPRLPNPAEPAGSSGEPGRERMEKEMAKKANQERQAQLKRDTDRLFKLATELKTSVDKSSENMLSLEVVKKAEEIEKLAHSVKEKMKGN
jgi:hypothetical protein